MSPLGSVMRPCRYAHATGFFRMARGLNATEGSGIGEHDTEWRLTPARVHAPAFRRHALRGRAVFALNRMVAIGLGVHI